MKNVLSAIFLLIPIFAMAQFKEQGKKHKPGIETIYSFLKPEGGSYYNLPNVINGKTLLKDYVNFNNKSDTIYLEKIVFSYNTTEGGFLVANELGSRRGIILSFKYSEFKKLIVDTCEETNYILKITKKSIAKCVFYMVETHYEDACLEENTCFIFGQSSDGRVSKLFANDSKLEYYEAFNYCDSGVSYSQNFNIFSHKGNIYLKVIKKDESSGKRHSRYYLYQNGIFNLCSKCKL